MTALSTMTWARISFVTGLAAAVTFFALLGPPLWPRRKR